MIISSKNFMSDTITKLRCIEGALDGGTQMENVRKWVEFGNMKIWKNALINTCSGYVFGLVFSGNEAYEIGLYSCLCLPIKL